MVKVFCKPRGSGAMGSGCPNLVFGEFGGRRGVLKAGLEKVNGGKCPEDSFEGSGVAVGWPGAEIEPKRYCRAGWVF